MKRFAMLMTALGAIALFSAPVMAADNYYYGGGHDAIHHAQDHAQLNYRAGNRAIQHHNAHDYGITRWQDARFHYQLNRQATRDNVRHHAAHDAGTYAPRRGYQQFGFQQQGVRIQTPGFGVWLGH